LNALALPGYFLDFRFKDNRRHLKLQTADLLRLLIPASTEGHLQQERLD
jgi:hypothetical protein